MKKVFRIFLITQLFCTVNLCFAEDALALLMQQLKSNKATKMAYSESRTLELVDQVWQGSGFLYSLPPDIMIREQLLPQRILMGINGNKMFYFDPENSTRYVDEFDAESPRSLSVAVFKALVNSDVIMLRQLYQIDFSNHPNSWEMTLKAKDDADSELNIVVSGAKNKQADKIIISQEAGEVSEFILEKNAEGETVKIDIQQLSQILEDE